MAVAPVHHPVPGTEGLRVIRTARDQEGLVRAFAMWLPMTITSSIEAARTPRKADLPGLDREAGEAYW